MYDKVRLWVSTRTATDVCQNLDKARELINRETGEVCTFGSLCGLKVSAYMGGVSVIGSLAKCLYPNNIYPMDAKSTAQAIEKLSDTLHLPMGDAKVTGLEFGRAFVMAHPAENYISRLGDMPRLLRCRFDKGTLYYKSKGKRPTKVYAFYDKREEAIAKGMVLPIGFENANLLKYEMRFDGRLAQQLGVADIKASTLTESRFYQRMVRLYQDSYFSISKVNQVKMDVMGEIKTVSDAFKVLVARLINGSDQTQITAFVEELKAAKVFEDRKSYTRLKQKIQEVAANSDVTMADELVKELDDAVRNVERIV